MKTQDGELGELYNRIGFLIRRAHQKSTATFHQINGITSSQYGALSILMHKSNIDQKSLAEYLRIDKTNAGVVVKSLEKHGFINRTPSTTDRRQKILQISSSGKLAYETISRQVEQAQIELVEKFTKEELDQFRSFLKRLVGD